MKFKVGDRIRDAWDSSRKGVVVGCGYHRTVVKWDGDDMVGMGYPPFHVTHDDEYFHDFQDKKERLG